MPKRTITLAPSEPVAVCDSCFYRAFCPHIGSVDCKDFETLQAWAAKYICEAFRVPEGQLRQTNRRPPGQPY